MNQFKVILERLKKPSVILSIASQIIAIFALLNVNIDATMVTGVITTGCSVLVMLGIMSNPSTKNKGFGDDILECAGCHKKTSHVLVGKKMVCSVCGTAHQLPS